MFLYSISYVEYCNDMEPNEARGLPLAKDIIWTADEPEPPCRVPERRHFANLQTVWVKAEALMTSSRMKNTCGVSDIVTLSTGSSLVYTKLNT